MGFRSVWWHGIPHDLTDLYVTLPHLTCPLISSPGLHSSNLSTGLWCLGALQPVHLPMSFP